ncbi:MAG: VOC family protein, partial [Methanococcaceae archaeon]
LFLQRIHEIPGGNTMLPAEQNLIMHIALPIGKENILMGSDILESQGQTLNAGNNFYISISTESEEEALRIFSLLSVDGKIKMPMGKTFWGSYFGMFTDKFGIQWMVSYEYKV